MAEEGATPPAAVVGEGTFQLGSGKYVGGYLEEGGVKYRHGQGRYEDANGQEVYEGGWEKDAMTGKGAFRSAAGAVYEVRRPFQPRARAISAPASRPRPRPDGPHPARRPQGDFVANMYQGEGTYRWPDGALYTGGWQFSRMHGEGTYTSKDGVRWTGSFFDGKFFNGRAYIAVR